MDKTTFFSSSYKPRLVDLGEERSVYIRKLSQAEVTHLLNNYLKDDKKQADGFAYVVCKATVTEDGERMFEDAEQSKMGKVDFDMMKKIAEEIIEFSGLGAAKNA